MKFEKTLRPKIDNLINHDIFLFKAGKTIEKYERKFALLSTKCTTNNSKFHITIRKICLAPFNY